MDVHHHAHTSRKKWTHYFWEFIMLFLAVFCGFLAEYQLEHTIERERGKKYLRSMQEDLKIDTATFAGMLSIYQEKLFYLQDFHSCYEAISQGRDTADCMATIFNYANSFPDLITMDRTLQQLKSTGGLRLLKDQDADSIILYDAAIRKCVQGERTDLQEVQTTLRNSSYDLISFRGVYRKYFQPDSLSRIPLLLPGNAEGLNKLFVILTRYLLVLQARMQGIADLKVKAQNLLHYFEQRYHFK